MSKIVKNIFVNLLKKQVQEDEELVEDYKFEKLVLQNKVKEIRTDKLLASTMDFVKQYENKKKSIK